MGKSRLVNRQFQNITITIFMNISEGGTRYSGKDIEVFQDEVLMNLQWFGNYKLFILLKHNIW